MGSPKFPRPRGRGLIEAGSWTGTGRGHSPHSSSSWNDCVGSGVGSSSRPVVRWVSCQVAGSLLPGWCGHRIGRFARRFAGRSICQTDPALHCAGMHECFGDASHGCSNHRRVCARLEPSSPCIASTSRLPLSAIWRPARVGTWSLLDTTSHARLVGATRSVRVVRVGCRDRRGIAGRFERRSAAPCVT